MRSCLARTHRGDQASRKFSACVIRAAIVDHRGTIVQSDRVPPPRSRNAMASPALERRDEGSAIMIADRAIAKTGMRGKIHDRAPESATRGEIGAFGSPSSACRTRARVFLTSDARMQQRIARRRPLARDGARMRTAQKQKAGPTAPPCLIERLDR
jgi:hypothetical protein